VRPIPICNGFICKYGVFVWLFAILLVLAPGARAEELVLEVIPLHHRTAAEMLPLLQPFIVKEGVIKAADNKLIVRTSPANLADLRKLIAELDKPLRRLMITVKQLSGDTARDSGAAVEGQIGEQSHIDARVWRTEKRDDADRAQQVQVVEGGQAFIDVGRQIPISDFTVERSRADTRVEQQTRYVGATTGFYARPRIDGDTVTIEISPYQTTTEGSATVPSVTAPTFNVQSLHTTISGKLGEWIELGASTTSTGEKDSGVITYSTSQRGEQDRRILLRVTVMP
jgi:type II secretory pathway component GspD/PulD (secretin)